MSEHFAFDDETMGVLMAGRHADSGSMTRGELAKLGLAVRALGQAKGLPLELVASGDLSETGPGDDEEAYATLGIGLVIERGGSYGPEKIDASRITGRLNAAKEISADVWKEVAALLPESAREDFLAQDVGIDLLCVGPLAAAYLAFGAKGSEEDGGEGEYVRGTDMNQEPHEEGVWGQRVASCAFEDSGHERIDFSEGAHQARLSAFPGGEYHVIARYD